MVVTWARTEPSLSSFFSKTVTIVFGASRPALLLFSGSNPSRTISGLYEMTVNVGRPSPSSFPSSSRRLKEPSLVRIVTHPVVLTGGSNIACRVPSLTSKSPSHFSTTASTHRLLCRKRSRVPTACRGAYARTTVSGDGSTELSPIRPSNLITTESSRRARCTVAHLPSMAPRQRTARRAPSPQPYASQGVTLMMAVCRAPGSFSRCQSRRSSSVASPCRPSCSTPCSSARCHWSLNSTRSTSGAFFTGAILTDPSL
jgi:hypothetical protein